MTIWAASGGLFCLLSLLAAVVLRLYATSRARALRYGACGLLFSAGLVSYGLAGEVFGGDAASHTARAWLYADSFAQGELPIWSNRWYLGYPGELYYGFLYYAWIASLSLLTGLATTTATQVGLVVLHVAAAAAFFRLARGLGAGDAPVLFGALFYTYSFQHIGIVILAGALPVSMLFCVLPAWLHVLDRVTTSGGGLKARSVQASLLATALVLSHVQYAFYAAVCVGAIAVVRIAVAARRGERATAVRLLRFLLTTAAMVAVCTAWFLVPMWLEREHLTMASDGLLDNLIQQGTVAEVRRAVGRLLIPTQSEDWLHFYLGWVPLSMVGLGVATLCRRPSTMSLVQAGYVWVLLATLPLAISSRFISVWFVLAAVVSVWGASALVERVALCLRGGRSAVIASALLIMALLAECSMSLLVRDYRRLPDLTGVTGDASTRLLVLEPSEMSLWRSLDVVASGRSTVFGGLPQSAPRSYVHLAGIATAAAADMVDRSPAALRYLTHDALRMLNVGTVMALPSGVQEQLVGATPAVFATTLVAGDPASSAPERMSWVEIERAFQARSATMSGAESIVASMRLAPAAPVAERIVMHPSVGADRILALGGAQPSAAAEFAVLDVDESHTRLRLTYEASAPGAVQLALSHFPYLRVRLDDEPVDAYPSALGLLVVEAPAGRHTIAVEAGISPLRFWLLGLSILGVVAILAAMSSGRTRAGPGHAPS